MRVTRARLAGFITGAACLGGAAAAHHAVQAQFDVNSPAVTLVGVLKKTEWISRASSGTSSTW